MSLVFEGSVYIAACHQDYVGPCKRVPASWVGAAREDVSSAI